MKRAALCLPLLLLAFPLLAQEDDFDRPPAIGRCEAPELRVRDRPSADAEQVGSLFRGEEAVVLCRGPGKERIDGREAAWYQVCTMEGVLGWVFGGYFPVDGGRIKEVSFRDYALPTVELKDYSEGFKDGSLSLIRVDWDEMAPSEFRVMFIKARGSAPKVLFTDFSGIPGYGRFDLGKIECQDLVGDGKQEVCVTVSGYAGDSSDSSLRVYGDLGKGYAYLGGIALGGASGGGGELRWGESVEGILVLIEKGRKIIQVVKVSVSTGYPEGSDAGKAERALIETTRRYEQVYELVGSKLVCTRTKDLSVVEKKVGGSGPD